MGALFLSQPGERVQSVVFPSSEAQNFRSYQCKGIYHETALRMGHLSARQGLPIPSSRLLY